jgi:hypothetical protein
VDKSSAGTRRGGAATHDHQPAERALVPSTRWVLEHRDHKSVRGWLVFEFDPGNEFGRRLPGRSFRMNLESVEKKLREAEFFLVQMNEQEARSFGDKEPFDFQLSAFLNAGRTVGYRLCHQHGSAYKAWRDQWNASNPKDDDLIKFFADDRDIDVHELGSSREVKQEAVPVRGHYSDKSGTLEVFSTPLPVAVAHNVPPDERHAVIYKPAYFFTIDRAERKATEACADYLASLKRMVAQFKADHS